VVSGESASGKGVGALFATEGASEVFARWEPLAMLGLMLSLAMVRWLRERSRFRSAERLARNARPGFRMSVSSREPSYQLRVTIENLTNGRQIRFNRRRRPQRPGR
jgi:hypothetical protein